MSVLELPPQMYIIACFVALLPPPAAGLGVAEPAAGVPKSAILSFVQSQITTRNTLVPQIRYQNQASNFYSSICTLHSVPYGGNFKFFQLALELEERLS